MPKKKIEKEEESPQEEKVKKVVVEEVEDETPEKEKEEEKKEEKVEETSDSKKEESSEEEEGSKKDKPGVGKLLWIIIPTTLLVGALAGGVITYFSGYSSAVPEPTPTAQATIPPDTEQTTTETTDQEKELQRSEVKIQVLNGSGVGGAAGKARDVLEKLGYVDVAVGNADSSTYTETEIAAKKDKSDYAELVSTDLKDSYSLASEVGTVPDTSDYDIIITLGSK